ncbi:MAG: OmpH family outer membrane protein [Flavobacteriales bacterium]
MKNIAIILLLAVIGISATVENETKIGYVYMDMVLTNMDEAKEMNLILEKFTQERNAVIAQKTEELQVKAAKVSKQIQAQELSEAGQIIAQNEIGSMQAALQALVSQNEQELYEKRVTLLSPIAKKLEEAMDSVAAEKGYKYVLNSSDGTGNSIVVVAPDADDLTQEVMAKLGVTLD